MFAQLFGTTSYQSPEPDPQDSKSTLFHRDVWMGRKVAVEKHLANGKNPNTRDAERQTPLHDAAWRGRAWITRKLVEGGADVNGRDQQDITPLHCAAIRGHTRTVRVLLDLGAKAWAKDCRKQDVLYWAAYGGDVEVIQILRRAWPGRNIDATDHCGKTALRAAAKYGHIAAVNALMGYGANPNKIDKRRGWTPMHVAAYHGRLDVVDKLQEWGGDLTIKDTDGNTPNDLLGKAGLGAQFRYWTHLTMKFFYDHNQKQ